MKKTWVSTFCFIILMVTAVAWAAPVPDTGQTKCYDVDGNVITCPSPGQPFYGQDANYSINSLSYTKLDGSGNVLPDSATSWAMVRDNVTGLIWELKTNKDGVKNYSDPHDADNTYSWYDSNPSTNGGYAGTPGNGTDTEDFIKALNDAHYGGYSDWRLPTIKELGYIVNFSIRDPGPTIHTGYFPKTAASLYWSSTTLEIITDDAWCVDFRDGTVNTAGKIRLYDVYVRAVRGGQSGALGNLVIGAVDSESMVVSSAAAGSYTDNGDGTVTDTSTCLIWEQAGSSNKRWDQALAYCEGLNLGGYTDWRLPTIKELHSLVDYSLHDANYPAINPIYFPNTGWWFYWSSTTSADDTDHAWGVDFSFGEVCYNCDNLGGYGNKDGSLSVRAVRGGQSGSLDHSVISVSPASRNVAKEAGTTTFSVTNTGTGTMPWTASVTSGSWLTITSGANGTNSGTINCNFTANTSTSPRTATIRVTATGATGSPVDVTVTQAPIPPCTATLDTNLWLTVPYIIYSTPSETLSLWAAFVYNPNPSYPTLIWELTL